MRDRATVATLAYADSLAKGPEARLGILTNGVQRRLFTDVVNPNITDKEPFLERDSGLIVPCEPD